MFTFIAYIAILIMCLIAIVWQIVHIVNDTKITGENTALWIVLTLFLGGLGFSIYKFVTKKVGAGLFWLLGFPTIIMIILGFGVLLDVILLGSM